MIAGNFGELHVAVRLQAIIEVLKELYASTYSLGFLVAPRAMRNWPTKLRADRHHAVIVWPGREIGRAY